jgi:cation:H+ antiporter
VLFVAAADLVFLKGSIYHGAGIGMREIFLTAFTILLNVVLLVGLLYRQKQGPANIGFESLAMLVLYVVGFLVLGLAM